MEQVLKGFKADGVHYHLIRIVGVVMFSLALSGFMALGFQNEKDQQAYLFGRVVVRTDIFVFFFQLQRSVFILMDGTYLIVFFFCFCYRLWQPCVR